MEITVLTENTVSRRDLLAEHGLSVLVEEGGKRILFDTGQSGVYIHNAEQLGISLEGLDAIVLSHGHYDHTGGLPEFPGEVSCPVYLSGKALEDKWCLAGDGKGNRCIGVPWREDAQELERLPLVFTWEQEEIFPGIYLLGQISTTVSSEMGEKPFRILQNGRYLPDTMEDEQLLVIRTPQGLAVFAGCAHPGILSCVEKVKRTFPGEKLYSLLAGMHLRGCPQERVEETITGLKEAGFTYLIPLHCTGTLAIARMKMAFGKSCLMAEAGKHFSL